MFFYLCIRAHACARLHTCTHTYTHTHTHTHTHTQPGTEDAFKTASLDNAQNSVQEPGYCMCLDHAYISSNVQKKILCTEKKITMYYAQNSVQEPGYCMCV